MTEINPFAAPAAAIPARTTRYSTRDVLRGFWRLLVGIKDMLALAFLLLFFMILFGALSAKPNQASFFGNGALVLKLDGIVVEQASQTSPFALLSGDAPLREFERGELVRALDAAAGDARVKAVVLDLDRFLGGGQVAIGDVAAAVGRVRAAKKPVLAYATAYTNDGYQLAANASEVWTENGGGVFLAGPGGSRLYYKGLIDRLGITAHIYRVGSFKSAVEPYTRADQSPEARESTIAYATVLWDSWQEQVKRARPAAKLDPFINDPAAAMRAAGNDMARAAQSAGLVDKLGSRIAFDRRVATIAGAPDDARPWQYNRIPLNKWLAANPRSQTGSPIAVVPLVGDIIDGPSDEGSAGGDTIANHILDAVADKDVKALVLRVDSPGGSVMASERIRSALLQAKARRMPIVVSMGNVAASGGYWVATPADRILAEPDTITGSIGVFAMMPSFENALGKIGITSDGITTSALSGQPDILGGPNAQFDTIAQAGVEDIYARFTGLVAASRRMPVERVREIAEGRVWAGGTARQLGLVDKFGGLDDAVAEAARLAKLDPKAVYARYYQDQPDRFSALISGLTADDDGEDDGMAPPSGYFGKVAWLRQAWLGQMLHDARRLSGIAGVEASCLECRGLGAPRVVTTATARAATGEQGMIARLLGLL